MIFQKEFLFLFGSQMEHLYLNPLSANPTICSNTLKQFYWQIADKLFVFDHFVKLVLKGLKWAQNPVYLFLRIHL